MDVDEDNEGPSHSRTRNQTIMQEDIHTPVFTAEPGLPLIPLRGSSWTTGGFAHGKAQGNTLNVSDHPPITLPEPQGQKVNVFYCDTTENAVVFPRSPPGFVKIRL